MAIDMQDVMAAAERVRSGEASLLDVAIVKMVADHPVAEGPSAADWQAVGDDYRAVGDDIRGAMR